MSDSVIQISEYHIRPDSGKIYFTYSDLKKMPEWPESKLFEIIHGDLFENPSPSINHQRIVGKLYNILSMYCNENQLGEVFQAPIDIIISEEDVVIPDLFFIEKSNSDIIGEKFISGIPNVIIEVLSSNSKRDLIEKKKMYEVAGVVEYFVIDIKNKKIIVHKEIKNNSYSEITEEYKSITIGSINDIVVSCKELFEIIK